MLLARACGSWAVHCCVLWPGGHRCCCWQLPSCLCAAVGPTIRPAPPHAPPLLQVFPNSTCLVVSTENITQVGCGGQPAVLRSELRARARVQLHSSRWRLRVSAPAGPAGWHPIHCLCALPLTSPLRCRLPTCHLPPLPPSHRTGTLATTAPCSSPTASSAWAALPCCCPTSERPAHLGWLHNQPLNHCGASCTCPAVALRLVSWLTARCSPIPARSVPQAH